MERKQAYLIKQDPSSTSSTSSIHRVVTFSMNNHPPSTTSGTGKPNAPANAFDTTIAAVSTPPGSGAIACIRMSGAAAIPIADKVFTAKNRMPLSAQANQRLYFGEVKDGHRVVDEVLLARFQAPHSYTGEDAVEITCHGSPYIQQEILRLLLEAGCQLAAPGEFTQRAFLNGKMDLSQAEAVADLIASSSAGAHRLAMNQMKGGFSHELAGLRAELLDFASLVELELDFAEEDVEFANRSQLKTAVVKIGSIIRSLADSFSTGNAIKNGIPVAIVGETNVGKSSLLNLLLREDRAIVSEIHGTTRDVIEDTITINGQLFRFIDTAGIRDTCDTIENLGIERTFLKLNQASMVLWVVDANSSLNELQDLAQKILPRIAQQKLLILFNKTDMLEPTARAEQEARLGAWLAKMEAGVAYGHIFLSARTGEQLPLLEALLINAASLPQVGENDVIVTNLRHYQALRLALAAIARVQQGLETGISSDFLAQDIRECMYHLGTIVGSVSSQDVLNNIFGRFCIGK